MFLRSGHHSPGLMGEGGAGLLMSVGTVNNSMCSGKTTLTSVLFTKRFEAAWRLLSLAATRKIVCNLRPI